MSATHRLPAVLVVASLLAGAGVAHAAEDRTSFLDRDARVLAQTARQQSRMTPSQGTPPARGAVEEASAPRPNKLRDLLAIGGQDLAAQGGQAQEAMAGGGYGGGGVQPPPPSGNPTQRFLRFLENGMKQAYGKSYQQGWKVLKIHVENALGTDTSRLPPGLVLALRTALDSSFVSTWEDRWEALHVGVKSLVQRPEPFLGGPESVFSGMLALGRQAAADKSYQNGYEIMRDYGQALVDHGQFSPDELHRRTVRTVLASASDLGSWEHRWKAVSGGLDRARQGVPNLGHFFAVAVQSDNQMSHESGTKVLRTFGRAAAEMGGAFPNELTRLAAEAVTEAGGTSDSWEDRWEVLSTGFGRLQDAVTTPADFFQLGLQCGGSKSYQNGVKVLRTFADRALGSPAMDQFTKLHLRSMLEAANGPTWESRWEVLRDGFRQAQGM